MITLIGNGLRRSINLFQQVRVIIVVAVLKNILLTSVAVETLNLIALARAAGMKINRTVTEDGENDAGVYLPGNRPSIWRQLTPGLTRHRSK